MYRSVVDCLVCPRSSITTRCETPWASSSVAAALDDVRLWQRYRLMDQMPTECLRPGIPLWISQPGDVRRRIELKHLPEAGIVIESVQRELQLAR